MTGPRELSDRSGLLAVHKPVGPTSRRVVDEVERELTNCKIGHGGTLDPMAEGLLPLHLNEATKLVPYLHEQPKTYRVRLRFDYRSESFDLGEDVESVEPSHQPDRDEVNQTLLQFTGETQQRPPKYSAIRSDGERLHELSRRNEDPSPESRSVTCHELTLLDYAFPVLTLRVTCGKGFYIRSLARDLAAALELDGGLVTVLLRTRYGPFTLDDCLTLNQSEDWSDHLAAPRKIVSGYHWVNCDADTIEHLTNGGWIERTNTAHETAMAIGPLERLHAVLQATDERGRKQWRPRRVLNRKSTPVNT